MNKLDYSFFHRPCLTVARDLVGKILVTGCLSQRYQKQILEEMPEVDGILGTGSYTDVVHAVESVMEGDQPTFFGNIHDTIEELPRMVTTPPYTAYLKIAEGCSNCCTYCAIPKIRGKFRSREMENIIAEAKSLAEYGVKELIVVAQDTTAYGIDIDTRRCIAIE